MTRKDFQLLANLRAVEAGVLAHNGNEQGACYLAGLAIECALKACIAKRTRRHDFPPDRKTIEEVYSHELVKLAKLAKLNDRLDKDMKKRAALGTNWGVVKGWTVASRYQTRGLKGSDMCAAVTGPDGVLN